VRVYNLTDVPTPALSARGLVGARLKVGSVEVLPGEYRDVPSLSANEQSFLLCGALSVGEPPAWYRAKKSVVPTPHEPTSEVSSSPPTELGPPASEGAEHVHTAETVSPGAGLVSEETHEMMAAPPAPMKKSVKKRKRGSR